MLNHPSTINMPCMIINFDNLAPSVRLLCTVRLLILAVFLLSVRLKAPVRLFATREYENNLVTMKLGCFLYFQVNK